LRLFQGRIFRTGKRRGQGGAHGQVYLTAMRLLRPVLVLLALVALALPALAREEIRSFAAEVTLRVDGSVLVTETLQVNAEGIDIRRGIYRDIPTVMLDEQGRKLRADLEVEAVLRDGRP